MTPDHRLAGIPTLVGVFAAIAACAQPDAPPGGEPDRSPPRVVEVSPEHRSVVDGWDAPVVFRFNERLSEQGIEDAVLVSPETGPVRVARAGWGTELRVRVGGGWRAGQVYRVIVRPTIQDLFRNSPDEPMELVFSTGPEIPRTAVAGTVVDRLSGEAVRDARVEAVAATDSTVHVATTDEEGIFVMRHLPAAAFDLRAYIDQNRSGAPDGFEAQDARSFRLEPADTALLALRLLVPDSSPAALARAVPEDSLHLRLEFDDAFDPDAALDAVGVRVYRLADSVEVPVDSVLHAHELRDRLQRLAAARDVDIGEPDTGARDSVQAVPDTTGADSIARAPDADSAAASAAAGGRQDAEPLPARELGLVLGRALRPETDYLVEVTGAVNIAGVPGGGGTARFRTPARRPEPLPADTAAPAPADPGIP